MPLRQSTRSRPSRKLAKIPILDALWEDLLKRLRQTDADFFRIQSNQETRDRKLA
jgi:hypothetical protein